MTNEPSSTDPKDVTPEKFSTPKDARNMEGAGTYPNYYSHKTRSGHNIIMDDSDGAEHVTIQHRGGSMIQFMPDGAVQFVSHNGQYNVVFGENRVKISGAQDVVVDGASSMMVKGDYNTTVQGNMTTTCHGDVAMVAKSFSAQVGENFDVQSQTSTMKSKNMTLETTGVLSLQGKGGVLLSSVANSVMMAASKFISMFSKGNIAMQGTSINMDGDTVYENSGKAPTDFAGTVPEPQSVEKVTT